MSLPSNRTLSKDAPSTQGYLIALLSAAILSTTAIIIRVLTESYAIPSLVLAFWRDVLVFLSLVVGLGVLRRSLLIIAPVHIRFLVLFGLVLAIFNSFWTLSVAINGASVATVLAYSSAAFTAVLGWWLLRESLNWIKLIAVAFSFTGVVMISGAFSMAAWQANLLGIFTGISSGLLYAIYSLMGRAAAQRGLNPWTTLCYTFGFATLFLLVINLFPGGVLPGTAYQMGDFYLKGRELSAWGLLILLAAGPTLAGFGLYNVSLVYLPSSVANLILTTEPAFTAFTAYLLLGERLSPIQIFGSLLILGSVVFLRVFGEGRIKSSRSKPEEVGIEYEKP